MYSQSILALYQFYSQLRAHSSPAPQGFFFKFWWDEETNILKEASVEANKAWKSAGKPRYGTVFHNRQSSQAKCRKRLKQKQTYSTEVYTNDLHEALLRKKTTAFWQC